MQLLYQKQTQAGLIEVWQKNSQRWLNIDAIEQTRIDINSANKLTSQLHCAFLAVLLFIEAPERVLLAGLGGGELSRYLHRINFNIRGDAVEINETIAEIAQQYFYFPEAQWTLNIQDIKQWQGELYDFIVVDIADRDLTPAWLSSEEMLLQFKQQLSIDGVLAINLLVKDASSLVSTLTTIRQVFKKKTLCLSVPYHKNIVVFAFNRPPPYRTESELYSRINQLAKVWGVDFKLLLAQLVKDNPVGSGVF